MKHRHAAALALVGWYLMTPPFTPDHAVHSDAPYGHWAIRHSFDRSEDCEREKYRLRKTAYDLLVEQRSDPRECDMCEAMCVATDDPRLKSN